MRKRKKEETLVTVSNARGSTDSTDSPIFPAIIYHMIHILSALPPQEPTLKSHPIERWERVAFSQYDWSILTSPLGVHQIICWTRIPKLHSEMKSTSSIVATSIKISPSRKIFSMAKYAGLESLCLWWWKAIKVAWIMRNFTSTTTTTYLHDIKRSPQSDIYSISKKVIRGIR